MGEETPIEKLFKLMDKNGDGYVSRKARRQKEIYLNLLKKVKSAIYIFVLSNQEFQQICKKMNKEQVSCGR